MARLARFERTTCRLGGGCSILLSYRRVVRSGELFRLYPQMASLAACWLLPLRGPAAEHSSTAFGGTQSCALHPFASPC